MAHIEDRWYKTVKVDNKPVQVPKPLCGTGMRYRVRYLAPDGSEKSESFPDKHKREAQAFLANVQADIYKGSYIDPAAGRMTFREYAEGWMRTRTFDESSRETTEFKVRKHLYPHFGRLPLSAIKPSHIREWDRAMVDVIALATRSVVFAHLRSILAAAVDDERIGKNPCAVKSVKQPRPPERRIVPWSVDRVTAVRSHLAPRYRAVVDLGAGCGLRQGEIFGIADEDLDFDGGWIHVRRQIKRVRSHLVFGLPKNDRVRKIPLSKGRIEALRAHVERYPPVAVTLPWEDPARSELVKVRLLFTTPRRNAINRSTFDGNSWRPALTRAGIPVERDNGMHALRHYFASMLLDAGESIKAVAEYLGHADPAFTLRTYTHLMPASEDRARNAIDRALNPDDGLATA